MDSALPDEAGDEAIVASKTTQEGKQGQQTKQKGKGNW